MQQIFQNPDTTPVEAKTTVKLYSLVAAVHQFKLRCGSVRSSAKRFKEFWGDAKFVILVDSKGKKVTGSESPERT